MRPDDEASLRARLHEAEETIRALVDDRVDAVVRDARGGPTLLRSAQRALREQEAELRAIFEGSRDALLIADDEGRYVAANPAACELVGLPEQALLGRTPADLTEPGFDLDAAWGAFLEAGEMEGEFVVVRPSGERRLTDFRARANIAPGRHLSSLRDVTDRRLEEERLRAVVDTAPIAIVAVDADGVITLAQGGRGLAPLRVTPESLVGRRASDLLATVELPGEGAVPMADALARVAAGEALEGAIRASDAELELRMTPREAGPGARRGALGVITDVSRLRRVERALQRTGETLTAVIEAAPVAIIRLDAEGRIRLWNGAAERIFGWGRDDLWGEPLPFADPALVEAVMREGRSFANLHVQRPHRDGHRLDLSLSLAPVRDAEGALVGAVGIFVDVSEERGLEAQLRQSQKMESVGRLAGGIAHDFNNMLAAILIIGHGLLEELPAHDPLRADLTDVVEAAERAAELTRQLLAFGRKQVLSPVTTDLNEQIALTTRILRRLVGEQVTLSIRPHDEPLPVLVDVTQLEQVLMNLVVNARDAMPDGGDLTVRTGTSTLREGDARPDGAPPGRYAELTVSDTGTGMDAETLQHAFEPFFTTKAEGQGTGLGLSTVYGIVRQSGGHLALESEPGRGTRARVLLPLLEEGSATQTAARTERPRSAATRGTVLVVEDEDLIREAMVRVLARDGLRVLEAANAGEALLIAEEQERPIHLLVTDVVMPRVSGPRLARRLRAKQPALRVLFVTGHPRGELDLPSEHDVLSKPFAPDTLLRAVRDALSRQGAQ
ncbi:MAG TPA: PAS domain S-box protein [Sandaracinaceae bacterium LLY-WYZ-13_1]|nr:PAS domain S-box protein [Sandaracinaceae bacterium LLY-WYZ-13_1]